MVHLTASPAAKGVPYYTPAQNPPAGTALKPEEETIPTLFTPLKMRNMTLQNRMVVSPMCQYSAEDGHLTDWHLVHIGQFALHGAALTMVEATSVQPCGRISPEDSGLWTDSQIAPLKRITDFIRSQGQHSAIQLAHAGRKASTLSTWVGGSKKKTIAHQEDGGWPNDTVAPSAISYDKGWPAPREMSTAEIKQLVQDFADAAVRAVKAGFDVIEIHGAHGYLLTQFMSPITNKRTDDYGGSFENRTRLVIEIIKAVRAVVPETMPVFLRISATEYAEYTGEPSWTVNDSIRLAKLLPKLGIDLLDVSTSGNTPKQKIPSNDPDFQTNLASQIREAVIADGQELLIGAVGYIATAERARDVVQVGANGSSPKADLAFAARQFQREPNFVLKIAEELGISVKWANQYHMGMHKSIALFQPPPSNKM